MSTLTRLFVCFLVSFLVPEIYADVNPDGSFSHTIPIEIPNGRNGLQPKLALNYNSNSGNGAIGVGWSLSGLPAITRMNYGNGINYGRVGFPADTYAGPEGRLIELGSGTGIYHSETESWSRYEAIGNCGNGPCSWKVTDRNGLVYHYGLTTNSRIIAKDANNNDINSGAVRVWALERVEDLNGNFYEVTYKKDAGLFYDSGQYYPEKISYTLGNGISKNYAISFFYDETGRPDKEISFATSAYVKTNWRLTKIAMDYQSTCFLVFTCADRIKSLVLTYENGNNIISSQFVTLQELDAATNQVSWVMFEWHAGESQYNSPANWSFPAGVTGINSGTNYPRWTDTSGNGDHNNLIDMNGDGKPDRVFHYNYVTNTPGLWVALSNGAGFSTPTNWSFPEGVTGVNSGTNYPRWANPDGSGDYNNLIDMNGDGKPDRVFHYNYVTNTPGLWVALNNGAGFSTPANWSFPEGVTGINSGTNYPRWTNSNRSGDFNNLIDMNGDGRPDRVFHYNYATNTPGLWVAINKTAGRKLTKITDLNLAVRNITYTNFLQPTGTICTTPCTSPDSSSLTYTNGIPNASPRYVVTQVTTTSNMDLDGAAGNDTQVTKYEYFNGRVTNGFVHERTNLGFEKIKTIDQNSGKYTITTYRQDKPFHGLASVTRNYLGSGELITEHLNAMPVQYLCDETGCVYDAAKQAHPAKPRQLRYMGETETRTFENGTLVARKQDEVMQYDAYGNALAIRTWVSSNWNHRAIFKFYNYINHITSTERAIGLAYSETTCLTASPCVENSANFTSGSLSYFDNLPLGQVGANHLLTKKETFVSTGITAGTQTGVWAPETFTYAANGLIASKTDATGVVTAFTYDTGDYYQYPESVSRSHGG
ncbi:MAG: hypothetical protein JNJ69_12820, partial [Leptospiraceae bacterium]|nr:hypothetical protein [Leptospiraceae bacterium]